MIQQDIEAGVCPAVQGSDAVEGELRIRGCGHSGVACEVSDIRPWARQAALSGPSIMSKLEYWLQSEADTLNFALVPIYSLGRNGSEDKFDLAELPYELLPGLTIEDVSRLLPSNAFELWKSMLGESIAEKVHVRYAFIRRFDEADAPDLDSGCSPAFATSCLRLIRPMRQGVLAAVRGYVADDGTLDVRGFDLSERQSGVEVVEAHKLSTLRCQDAAELRVLLPEFVRAMEGDFWKFRMAVQFHDLGYFQSYNWKPRFLLWCSALESIYTSHNREHQGKRVAVARIKWFLGENTRIYDPHDWPRVIPDCPITVSDVLDDLYELRNFVAHGDRIPDSFFHSYPRSGINGGVCKAELISEATSFIIRASLRKILREKLLDHFVDAAPAEAYFAAQGLVNSKLDLGRV